MPYLERRHLDRRQHGLERRLIGVALQSVNMRANVGGRDDQRHVRRVARVKGERRRRALGACVVPRECGGGVEKCGKGLVNTKAKHNGRCDERSGGHGDTNARLIDSEDEGTQ